MRNLGGAIGVALTATVLARRSQGHYSSLVSHVTAYDPETTSRLAAWTAIFAAQGADAHTAGRRALAALSHEVGRQAQVLAFADDFWLLFLLFCSTLFLLPLLNRVRTEPASTESGTPTAPAAVVTE